MTDPAAAAPAPAKASLIEDFVDVFFSPAKMFARRAGTSPALPYIIVCVLLVGMFFVNRNVMSGIMAGEIQKAMDAAAKSNPQISGDVAEKARGFMQTTFTIGAIVGVPIALLLIALLTWIVGKVLGGAISYGTALLIASFAFFPRVLESVVTSVQGIMLDTGKMTSHFQLQIGPARFLDPATAPAWQLGLLGRVDLFTLWVTVLFAIGLVYAGKVPKGKMVLAGVVMWVVGSLPALYQALKG
jgi:hypothetical protein